MTEQDVPLYVKQFRGAFVNMLRWPQFEALWQQLEHSSGDWYVYALQRKLPQQAINGKAWQALLSEVASELRHEHQEEYCGIVYADNPDEPGFVKIYDPRNLGVVCGISGSPPPLPAWTFSRAKPVAVDENIFPTPQRPIWWKQLCRNLLGY